MGSKLLFIYGNLILCLGIIYCNLLCVYALLYWVSSQFELLAVTIFFFSSILFHIYVLCCFISVFSFSCNVFYQNLAVTWYKQSISGCVDFMFSLSVIYVLLVWVYVLPVRKSMFSLLENCVLLVLFVCSPYTTRRTWTINWPFLRVLRAFLVFLDPISSSTFKPKSKKYNFERENMGEHTRSWCTCCGWAHTCIPTYTCEVSGYDVASVISR